VPRDGRLVEWQPKSQPTVGAAPEAALTH